jgi:outer membrane lipoprotein SlyB
MKFRNALIATALVCMLGACAGGGDTHESRDAARGDSARSEPDRDVAAREARCQSCGVVERIDVSRPADGGTTGAGAVAGALTGAPAGNQAGSGSGRGGGQVFALTVRMDDGRRVVIEQRALQGVREGARVMVRGGSVQLM